MPNPTASADLGVGPAADEGSALLERVREISDRSSQEQQQNLRRQLAQVFASPSKLSALFQWRPSAKSLTSRANSAGVDFGNVREFYRNIRKMSETVGEALVRASETLVEDNGMGTEGAGSSAEEERHQRALIRCWLVILLNPMLLEPENQHLLCMVASRLNNLRASQQSSVRSTLVRVGLDEMEQIVATLQNCITLQLFSEGKPLEAAQQCTRLLRTVFGANRKVGLLPAAAFYNDAVNNPELVNVEREFMHTVESPRRYTFSFADYPFVFDMGNKARILQLGALVQISEQTHRAILEGLMGGGMLELYNRMVVRRDHIIHDTISHMQRRPEDLRKQLQVQFAGEDGVDEGGVRKEFFQLVVRELFDPKYGMFAYSQSTHRFWFTLQTQQLLHIQQRRQQQLQAQQQRRKGLVREPEKGLAAKAEDVDMVGKEEEEKEEEEEMEVEDEEYGGVSAWWRRRHGRQKLEDWEDPDNGGPWEAYHGQGDSSRARSPTRGGRRGATAGAGAGVGTGPGGAGWSLGDQAMEYELVGLLLGLAIYNSCILEVRFPLVLYKKLLGLPPTLDDLAGIDPDLAKGLRDLLSFEGDVEEVYGRCFQVEVEDLYDGRHTVDLKPGGADTPLTSRNRHEYVERCVQFYLTESVAVQFEAFARGFRKLCSGRVLDYFEPQELELLVCGTPVVDLNDLESSARYADGYTKNSRAIHDFWEVVHHLSEDDKRNLLMFVTGCDRVPIRGLASLNFTISRNGPDSDRLPTAHTCFNHLLLPEYSSLPKLKDRLLLAIHNAQGFGLR